MFHNYAPSLSGSGFFSLVSVCFKLVGSNAVMPCKTCCWLFSTATSIIQMDIIGKKTQHILKFITGYIPWAEGNTIFSSVVAFFSFSVLKPSNWLFRFSATLGKSLSAGAAGAAICNS